MEYYIENSYCKKYGEPNWGWNLLGVVKGILKFGDVSFQVGKTIYVGLYWFKKRDGEREALGRPLVVGNIIIIIEGSFFSMVPKDLNSLELKRSMH